MASNGVDIRDKRVQQEIRMLALVNSQQPWQSQETELQMSFQAVCLKTIQRNALTYINSKSHLQ